MIRTVAHAFDVVVVGAGGAGLRAALGIAIAGYRVAVVTKLFPTRSHTGAAQGGIGAALGNMGDGDTWQNHMYDTVKGGDWLGDQDAIEVMCREASAAVIELEHMGVPFSRNDAGRIYQRPFGGHTLDLGAGDMAKRACAAADRTGHAILHTLYQQCLKYDVQFFIEYVALDLVMAPKMPEEVKSCVGITAWCLADGTFHSFAARTTVLATGGYGKVYQTATSAHSCTGDGGGMILRAGLWLQDMEFVQFHPTGLYGAGCLISEAARGEGGVLRNSRGEAFMARYAPRAKDLASRDVVSRAIATEIQEGRGVGPLKDHIWLHVDHLPETVRQERLPGICETAQRFAGCDPSCQPIPVCPTVHYNMGGIPTNRFTEVRDPTDKDPDRVVEGLMAIGEAACVSVHGANRLGTNSLLDIIVFGRVAARRLQEILPPQKALPTILEEKTVAPLKARFLKLQTGVRNTTRPKRVADVREAMQQVMQRYCSVFRHASSLDTGLEKLHAVAADLPHVGLADSAAIWNTDLCDLLELHNLMGQAFATISSALYRQESRGAHTREDFPDRDDTHIAHTLVKLTDNPWQIRANHETTWNCMHSKRPVCLKPLSHEAPYCKLKKRIY